MPTVEWMEDEVRKAVPDAIEVTVVDLTEVVTISTYVWSAQPLKACDLYLDNESFSATSNLTFLLKFTRLTSSA